MLIMSQFTKGKSNHNVPHLNQAHMDTFYHEISCPFKGPGMVAKYFTTIKKCVGKMSLCYELELNLQGYLNIYTNKNLAYRGRRTCFKNSLGSNSKSKCLRAQTLLKFSLVLLWQTCSWSLYTHFGNILYIDWYFGGLHCGFFGTSILVWIRNQ